MGVAAGHSHSLMGCGRRIFAHRDFPSGCGRKVSASEKRWKRRISANRKFPPGCGRKVCFVTAEMNPFAETVWDDSKQVSEKVLDESPSNGLKENIVQEMAVKIEIESEGDVGKEEQVQVRTTSQSAIKNIEGIVGSLKGEMGNESVESCKKSSKRTFPGESRDENDAISKCPREQSIGLTSSGNKVPWQPSMAALNFSRTHGEYSPRSNLGISSNRNSVKKHELMVKKTDLGPSNNRVIVQALMAAPNCPWRQGKRKIKGNLTNNQKQC